MPAISSDAVVPDTVHTVGVVDAKATASPELAVAVNANVVLALCAAIELKVMVCAVLPVPVPFSWIVCAEVAFSALSLRASDPLRVPVVVGVKLIAREHEALAAKLPGPDAPVLTSGQADAPPLFRLKLSEILGLLPLLGTDIDSVAFPIFEMVTV